MLLVTLIVEHDSDYRESWVTVLLFMFSSCYCMLLEKEIIVYLLLMIESDNSIGNRHHFRFHFEQNANVILCKAINTRKNNNKNWQIACSYIYYVFFFSCTLCSIMYVSGNDFLILHVRSNSNDNKMIWKYTSFLTLYHNVFRNVHQKTFYR